MPSLIILHGGRIHYLSALSMDDTWKAIAEAQGNGVPLIAEDVDGRAQIIWARDVEDVQDAIDLRTG